MTPRLTHGLEKQPRQSLEPATGLNLQNDADPERAQLGELLFSGPDVLDALREG
jgi:hypothetical protein